jgi:hypothetical protein
MKLEHSYSLDQCDIHDKSNGEKYRQHRLKWIGWLIGSDPHAISRQISSMLWEYALFSAVNEARRISIEEPGDGVGFNVPVMRLFDAGFVSTQATAIRRLIERPARRPERAVISLRSILADFNENHSLLTRENYVCYDGLPYDYQNAHEQWLAEMLSDSRVRADILPTSGPKAFYMSELHHKAFDELAVVTSNNRQRLDKIDLRIFHNLENLIQSCEDIKKYVDKFLAHASAPATREELTDEQKGVTLDRLKAHHKTIYQVAQFILIKLLYETNLGGVPVPQYDHIENLDKSWSTTSNLSRIRKKWREYTKEVSGWGSAPL